MNGENSTSRLATLIPSPRAVVLLTLHSIRPSRRSLTQRLRTLDSVRPSLRAIDRMDSLPAQAITTASSSSVQGMIVRLPTGDGGRDTPANQLFRGAYNPILDSRSF